MVNLPAGRAGVVGAAVAVSLTWLAVCFIHGVWPGRVHVGSISYLVQGAIDCVQHGPRTGLRSFCTHYGAPGGSPLLSDGPVVLGGALLSATLGVSVGTALTLMLAVVLAVGVAGATVLLTELGAPFAWAVVGAFVYEVSPTVMGLQQFIGTYEGFVLLAAYVVADLVAVRVVLRRGLGAAVAAAVGLVVVRTAALFLDGYSFTASALVSVGLVIFVCGRPGSQAADRVRAGALVAVANVSAVAIYSAYAPGGERTDFPLTLISSLGLDLTTLGVPSDRVGFARLLGLGHDYSALWGDVTNAEWNYVGYVCALLAAVGLWSSRRRRLARALVAAGAVAFVLSLGAVVKVDARTPTAADGYVLPAGAARSLPTAAVYELPGINAMRASYRWFGVTRLVLVALAGIGLVALARRGGGWRWVAVVLAGLFIAELLPDVAGQDRAHRSAAVQMRQVARDVRSPLRALTDPAERLVFASFNGQSNDFLAPFLAAGSGYVLFNAGGDKDVALARASWPPLVQQLIGGQASTELVQAVLASDQADAVVLPRFDLHEAAFAWPPASGLVRQADHAFAPLLRDPRFTVARSRWFSVVRLAPPA